MKTKDMTMGAIFVALISIGSKIAIPLDVLGMRFTLQWLFVLLCARCRTSAVLLHRSLHLR